MDEFGWLSGTEFATSSLGRREGKLVVRNMYANFGQL